MLRSQSTEHLAAADEIILELYKQIMYADTSNSLIEVFKWKAMRAEQGSKKLQKFTGEYSDYDQTEAIRF